MTSHASPTIPLRMRLPSSLSFAEWRGQWYTAARLPPHVRLYGIGGIVAMAGLLYGLDTGSIGPITEMHQFNTTIGGPMSPGLRGFFVASILLSAALSSLCSGFVADAVSRRYAIVLGALLCTLGAVLSASSSHLAALIVARLISGVGAGQSISVASIYLIEIATAEVRGKLACMVQFAITIGIMIGYFITYGSQRIESSLAWRMAFIVQALFAVTLAVCVLVFVPFSPRWLAQRGQDDAALQTLRRLRLSSTNHTVQRASDESRLTQELADIKAAIATSRLQQQSDGRGGSKTSYAELFNRRNRVRVLQGVALMTFQQLSGIDVILYFAPVVFASIFASQTASFLASGVSGVVLVVSTIPAQLYVDRWGRKPMMTLGGGAMASCFLVIGAMFAKFGQQSTDGAVTLQGKAPRYTVVALIYIFISLYSMTWAVVTRVYAIEITPLRLRSRAAAVQQLANWTTNFIVALTAPAFLRATPSGPYFFFAGCLTLTTIACAVFMRETKNRSLEQIDSLFGERAS